MLSLDEMGSEEGPVWSWDELCGGGEYFSLALRRTIEDSFAASTAQSATLSTTSTLLHLQDYGEPEKMTKQQQQQRRRKRDFWNRLENCVVGRTVLILFDTRNGNSKRGDGVWHLQRELRNWLTRPSCLVLCVCWYDRLGCFVFRVFLFCYLFLLFFLSAFAWREE